MKRVLSIAAVLLLVFSLSASAAANTWVLPEGQHSYMMQVPPSGQDDPPIFIYTLNDNDEAEIIDFFGEAYDLKNELAVFFTVSRVSPVLVTDAFVGIKPVRRQPDRQRQEHRLAGLHA